MTPGFLSPVVFNFEIMIFFGVSQPTLCDFISWCPICEGILFSKATQLKADSLKNFEI